MNTDPTKVVVEEPAPGYFVITGHNPVNVKLEGNRVLCVDHVTVITPELPSEVLLAILEARTGFPMTATELSNAQDAEDYGNELETVKAERDRLLDEVLELKSELARVNIPVITEGQPQTPPVVIEGNTYHAEAPAPPKNKGGRPKKVQPEEGK